MLNAMAWHLLSIVLSPEVCPIAELPGLPLAAEKLCAGVLLEATQGR